MAIRNGTGYVFSTTNNQSTIGIEKEFADMYDGAVQDVCAPFKVKNVQEVTEGETTIVTYDICPGTFNNLMPQVYNETEEAFEYLDDLTTGYKLILDFASTSSCIVYLRAGPEAASPYAFPPGAPITPYDPADPYPTVFNTGGTLPADTDTYGYLALAKVNSLGGGVYTVDQYVTGSLWADRIKLAGITARYYYARI